MNQKFKNIANRVTVSMLIMIIGCIYGYSQTHHHSHDHETHSGPHNHKEEFIPEFNKLVTGQGEFIFSWDESLTNAFPADAREFEPAMHGGFNEDPETGKVYTGIPGYGLCEISADLKQWTTIGSDPRLKDNIHGIVLFIHKGEKLLALAQEGKRVLVTTLDGNIVSDILKPKGVEFDFPQANYYFASDKSNFGVTDVTYLNGIIYVAHGYSAGDFVLTITEQDGSWDWGRLAWGGKGDQPGQFKTAHGIYAHQGLIYVANRAAGQVVRFTPEGEYLDIFEDIPSGSLVCNLSYKDEHYFFNSLRAIGDQKSAPIYTHTGDKLVSTVLTSDLEIPVITNIHHVWPHHIKQSDGTEQLYLLVHAWNKGKYAVLKLEK